MKTRDVMTSDPVAVEPGTPVEDVARLIVEHRLNGVPVVDAAGLLLGIVTGGDLMHRALDEHLEPRVSLWKENFWRGLFRRRGSELERAEGRVAAEVMTRDVVTVSPDTDVIVVARLLTEHAVKALPVLDDGRLVGIISRLDLLKLLGEHPEAFNPMAR